MLKDEVKVGRVYLMNHSSGKIKVKILMERSVQSYGGRGYTNPRRTHWVATNLKTGRQIEIKSAQKLLHEIAD